jgi:hypothetical protein
VKLARQLAHGVVPATLALACFAACQPSDVELPPVRTPVRLRVACSPPKRAPISGLVSPPIGSSCGLPDLECGQIRPLVIQVNEPGRAVAAHVPGSESPDRDACVLKEILANGWQFEPARDCTGEPMAASFTTDENVVCGYVAALRTLETRGRTKRCS